MVKFIRVIAIFLILQAIIGVCSAASSFAQKISAHSGVHDEQIRASSDSSVITIVRIGVINGSKCHITGKTTGSAGSSIKRIEISTDEGENWSLADDTSGNGTWATWSFEWMPAASGTFPVMVRATEAGKNNHRHPKSITVTVETVAPHLNMPATQGLLLAKSCSNDRVKPGIASTAPVPLSDLLVSGLSSGLSSLRQEWKYRGFGSGIGAAGICVSDIDGDGALELVMGGNSNNGFGEDDNWYVLRKNGDKYEMVWNSDIYPSEITRMAVADGDSDGIPEIYVGLADGTVNIYDGRTKMLKGSIQTGGTVSALTIADADGDGAKEIITSDGTNINVFNGATLEKKWESPGYGGSDIAVGNVDTDSDPEIVSSSGYVIDGVTHEIKWSYTPGFGYRICLGDINNDGKDEIIGASTWYHITAFDAKIKSPIWQINTPQDIDALLVADVDGDNVPEVLYGDGQWGKIHCIDGVKGTEKWSINNPEHGVTNIAVADVDNDGKPEVIWGAGWTDTGPDYLYIADIDTLAIQWQSADIDGPFSAVDAGDVDGDGKDEIVMVSNASNSYYGNPVILVFDGETHELKAQAQLTGINAWCGVGSVKVADVDNDGANEIVVATADLYDGLVQVYDGKTLKLKYQTAKYTGDSFTAMAIGDVDNDGRKEVVVGELREHTGASGVNLVAFDASTGAEKWKSIDLGVYWGEVHDIKLADIDNDGHMEIITSMAGNYVYVFDGVNHVEKQVLNIPAYALETSDVDGDGNLEVLVGRSDGKVDVYDGKTFNLKSSYQFGSGTINGLKVAEVESGKGNDWLVCEDDKFLVYDGTSKGLLSEDTSLGSYLGGYNHIAVEDFDSSGKKRSSQVRGQDYTNMRRLLFIQSSLRRRMVTIFIPSTPQ